MDKIYSRGRIKLPKIKFNRDVSRNNYKEKNAKTIKMLKILTVISIAMIVVWKMMSIIEPILNSECVVLAKSIATQVANEQASSVMSKYKYEDLCSIERDNSRKYKNN